MQNTSVYVKTTDGYTLHGLLSEGVNKDTIIIHMHGSAGNFYVSTFFPELRTLADAGICSFLSTNSRGTGVYDVEVGTKYRGSAIEIFEECVLDIDAWIEYALERKYTNIILEGHSFGTNKIQYYALQGKYRDKIKALILLGFTDSYGTQLKYLARINKENSAYLQEANNLLQQGKPLQLLSDPYANCGELPQTAQSYASLMSDNSELSNVLPFRNGTTLPNYSKINIPMLGVIGDRNEYTVIPISDAIALMKKENKYVTIVQITDCSHGYEGKETELGVIIKKFIETTS